MASPESFGEDIATSESYEVAKLKTANQIQLKLIELAHSDNKDLLEHAQNWLDTNGEVFRTAFAELCVEYPNFINDWNPTLEVKRSSDLQEGESRIEKTLNRDQILEQVKEKMEEVRDRPSRSKAA